MLVEIIFFFLSVFLGSTHGRLGDDPKNRRHFCKLQIYLKIRTKGRPDCYSKLSSFSCSVEMDSRPTRVGQKDVRFLVLSFLCACSENNHLCLCWTLVVSVAGAINTERCFSELCFLYEEVIFTVYRCAYIF